MNGFGLLGKTNAAGLDGPPGNPRPESGGFLNGNTITSERGSATYFFMIMALSTGFIFEMGAAQSRQVRTVVLNSRLADARNAVSTLVNRYATLPATFRQSLDPNLPPGVNSELRNCTLGVGPGPCQAGVELPVTLYFPVGGGAIQALTGPLGGPAPSAQAYDSHGSACQSTSASLTCPFLASSSFVATCAGGAPTCAVAQSIEIHYQVSAPLTEMPSKGTVTGITPIPPLSEYSTAIPVATILPALAGTITGPVDATQLIASASSLSYSGSTQHPGSGLSGSTPTRTSLASAHRAPANSWQGTSAGLPGSTNAPRSAQTTWSPAGSSQWLSNGNSGQNGNASANAWNSGNRTSWGSGQNAGSGSSSQGNVGSSNSPGESLKSSAPAVPSGQTLASTSAPSSSGTPADSSWQHGSWAGGSSGGLPPNGGSPSAGWSSGGSPPSGGSSSFPSNGGSTTGTGSTPAQPSGNPGSAGNGGGGMFSQGMTAINGASPPSNPMALGASALQSCLGPCGMINSF